MGAIKLVLGLNIFNIINYVCVVCFKGNIVYKWPLMGFNNIFCNSMYHLDFILQSKRFP
jgi:hypothetical protein